MAVEGSLYFSLVSAVSFSHLLKVIHDLFLRLEVLAADIHDSLSFV